MNCSQWEAPTSDCFSATLFLQCRFMTSLYAHEEGKNWAEANSYWGCQNPQLTKASAPKPQHWQADTNGHLANVLGCAPCSVTCSPICSVHFYPAPAVAHRLCLMLMYTSIAIPSVAPIFPLAGLCAVLLTRSSGVHGCAPFTSGSNLALPSPSVLQLSCLCRCVWPFSYLSAAHAQPPGLPGHVLLQKALSSPWMPKLILSSCLSGSLSQ